MLAGLGGRAAEPHLEKLLEGEEGTPQLWTLGTVQLLWGRQWGQPLEWGSSHSHTPNVPGIPGQGDKGEVPGFPPCRCFSGPSSEESAASLAFPQPGGPACLQLVSAGLPLENTGRPGAKTRADFKLTVTQPAQFGHSGELGPLVSTPRQANQDPS